MAKVFISHSSSDKEIVRLFKDIILKAGIGLSDADIFFTSSPETGVPIGKNIPEYIKTNLRDCDYAFLMISENYKKSEVCLNEMGAAMVLGKRLFPILLYDYDFDKVGWLIDRDLCVRVDDQERLDEIRDVFYEDAIKTCTSVWNKSRFSFVEAVRPLNCITEDGKTTKGYVDYQIEIEDSLNKYNRMFSDIVAVSSSNISSINAILEELNISQSLSEQKMLLGQIAIRFNSMADYMEKNNNTVRDSVLKALDSVWEIFNHVRLSEPDRKTWKDAVSYFKSVTLGQKAEIEKAKYQVIAFGDLEERQIHAKNRVVSCYEFLIETCSVSIEKANQVLFK